MKGRYIYEATYKKANRIPMKIYGRCIICAFCNCVTECVLHVNYCNIRSFLIN